MTFPTLCAAHSSLIALRSKDSQISYAELLQNVEKIAEWLQSKNAEKVALQLGNSVDWVIWDLACQMANCICIPVPLFFSETQQRHLLNQSGAQLLVTESERQILLQDHWQPMQQSLSSLSIFSNSVPAKAQIPDGTGKITFTSGSTGQPKGVCLSTPHQWQVARSLWDRIALQQPRHLVLLPLATLLENVAGIYAPLLAGGEIFIASEAERGFSGSQLENAQRLLQLISETQPNTLILVPELLMVLQQGVQMGWQVPTSLRFIAVGGSKVNPKMLLQARQHGLPVYEGYGLSECCSVVSLNTPDDDMADTAGAILPHCAVSIENDQVIVSGSVFLGYVNQPGSFYPEQVCTGDIGELQNQHLLIKGRIKNQFINSYGRNFSPEWIEAQFIGAAGILQIAVQGDSLPYCSALIFASPEITEQQLQEGIANINRGLPDYAQVRRWHRLPHPLNHYPNLLTSNGKLKRDAIAEYFRETIANLYQIRFASPVSAAAATQFFVE